MKPNQQQLDSSWEFSHQDLLVDMAAVVAAKELESPNDESTNLKPRPALDWSEWQSVT